MDKTMFFPLKNLKYYKLLLLFFLLFCTFKYTNAQDGSLDLSFDPGTGFNNIVWSTAIQSDGKIIAGGGFSSFNGIPCKSIVRLLSDGTIDTSFNPTEFQPEVRAVAIQNDGKIIIGGSGTIGKKIIIRFNSNGSLDTSFVSPDEFYNGSNIRSIAIQNDGKIIVGGFLKDINGKERNVARLNINGSLDSTFNLEYEGIWGSSVSLQNDGKIIVVGNFRNFSYAYNCIARLNTDGSTDTTFIPGGFDDYVTTVKIQSDGKIITGGRFNYHNGVAIRNIARLNSDGSLDNTFNSGTGFNDVVYSLVIQNDGKIIAGGFFTNYNNVMRNQIARLNSNGSLDTSFYHGTGFNFNSFVATISLQSNGKIIAGGDFTSYDGFGRNSISRLYGNLPPGSYSHYLKGFLYGDQNKNCEKQIYEPALPFVVATDHSYSFADSTGYYSLGVFDSVNYTVKAIIPQRLAHIINDPCPIDYAVYMDASHPEDTTGFDFGFDYTPCHQLRVDIGSNLRRRCIKNRTSVFYTNEGIIAANGVEVHVKLPQYVFPISASLPYNWNTSDSTMVFNIGKLNIGQFGTITIIDSVACIQGIMGLTQCTKAWITPANSCIINNTASPGWDNSSLMVKGSCKNDSVEFRILNTGDPGIGDMNGTSDYRIFADNALVETKTFQIKGGDSLTFIFVSGGSTLRMEADQRPGHPGNSHPHAVIEACGTDGFGNYSMGIINLTPPDDKDVHVEIDCMPIVDSYDPNDKQTSPAGVGPENIVLPGTLLDYKIRFQNTGSATAFKVVVVDTLSSHLDISTLELGASSFPYSIKLSGEGKPVISFTFDGINLTDTLTNELNSHGFVKFKIAPFETVPLGTRIENFADIFFDYNLPIKTNLSTIKIDKFDYSVADLAKLLTQPPPNSFYCKGDSVTLAADFTGNNLTYQWYKDSLPIPGATSDFFRVVPVSATDVGNYYCKATGHLNSRTTLPANLIINPVEVEVTLSDVTLTSQAKGAVYQWVDCDNFYSFLEGETRQFLTARANGNYAVMVTENGCTDTSSCFSIVKNNGLIIYPNPTNGNIILNSFVKLNNARVKIITLTGHVVFEKENLNGNQFYFDLRNNSRGAYIIEIKHDNDISRLKLVVN